jgi:hypothetical protein
MSTDARSSLCDDGRIFWIKRSWTRLWWVALNPDEALALFDTPTIHRAWTRERLVAKLERKTAPKDDPWEEVCV